MDEPATTPRVVGSDDWARRKGQRYGTIVVDLERSEVVNLLPDRDAGTVVPGLAVRDVPGLEAVPNPQVLPGRALSPGRRPAGRGPHERGRPEPPAEGAGDQGILWQCAAGADKLSHMPSENSLPNNRLASSCGSTCGKPLGKPQVNCRVPILSCERVGADVRLRHRKLLKVKGTPELVPRCGCHLRFG
jgi:hypothetical protein